MGYLFFNYTNSQIKQRANSKMLYSSYITTLYKYNVSFAYKMLWQKQKNNKELLVKENLATHKREYIGERSEQTEQIRADFERQKSDIKQRLSELKTKMIKDKKLNKIEGIARAPKELVAIFQKINELQMDSKILVIGTNSLYAYEARANVFIEDEHLSTYDIDLFNKREKGISFIFSDSIPTLKAIDFLHTIDKTFEQNKKIPYRFENSQGVWVELINPVSNSVKIESYADNIFSDVIPLAMNGMQWLNNSRTFEEIIIGENGECAMITTIHPLEYAIFKNWLSQQNDRDRGKYFRDLEQSKLVTELIQNYLVDISIEEEILTIRHFKKEVVESFKSHILK